MHDLRQQYSSKWSIYFYGLLYTKTSTRKGNSALTSSAKKDCANKTAFFVQNYCHGLLKFMTLKKMLISLPSFCLSLSRFQSKSKLDLKTTWHLPSYLHILHIIIFSNFPNSGWSLWRNKYIFCIYHLSSEP